MGDYVWLLVAVVVGWLIQSFMAFRQSMAFNDAVRRLRRSGGTAVGCGGRRYRGGRAFVAIAVDESGVVRDALTLRGFTTFARANEAPALVGLRVNRLAGDREVPGLSRQEREAARAAAELFRASRQRAALSAEVTP